MQFTRFRRASDIPRRLYAQNSQLSGIVAATHWNAIGVWHVPVTRKLLRWKHHPPCESTPMSVQNAPIVGLYKYPSPKHTHTTPHSAEVLLDTRSEGSGIRLESVLGWRFHSVVWFMHHTHTHTHTQSTMFC